MQNIKHRFDIACITGIQSKKIKIGKSRELLAYDIKIKVECNETFLQSLSYGTPPKYNQFLFEDDGVLKADGISNFVIERDIVEHRLLIDLELVEPTMMHFNDIQFSDFKIKPIIGFEYLIVFSIRIETNDDELLFLNKAAKQKEVVLTIEPPITESAFWKQVKAKKSRF